jgi:hypothetical protein
MKQHEALAVAVRPDAHALVVSPNSSAALHAPVGCCSRFCSADEEVSEKPAVADALQASLLQGQLGVLCI